MFDFNLEQIIANLYQTIFTGIEFYFPKVVGAFVILLIGTFAAIGAYKFVIYLFKRFKIIELIDKLEIDFSEETQKEANLKTEKKGKEVVQKTPFSAKFSKKIKIDVIVGKSIGYYVFLIFFRYAIVVIGIEEVEQFLADLIAYLPSLFIGFVIGFFGIRFANFVYDVIYHALNLTKQKTAKIIASGAKIVILFFTLMAVLDKIGIATEITNTILTGFIAMLTIAGGLAFGLGGKDIAHEILESFRK